MTAIGINGSQNVAVPWSVKYLPLLPVMGGALASVGRWGASGTVTMDCA